MGARMHATPTFARNSLLACDSCGEVFLNWTRTRPVCRKCGAAGLHEVRWPQG